MQCVPTLLQRELFDNDLAEVRADDGVRYILRRNPFRASEIRATRDDKLRSLRKFADSRTRYLAEHPRAKVEVALRNTARRCEKLRLSDWASVKAEGRKISVSVDAARVTLPEALPNKGVIVATRKKLTGRRRRC